MFLKLNDLKLTTILGIYDWEQTIQRQIIINATITTIDDAVLESNDIKDSVDYDTITNKIKEITAQNHQLAEELANKIVDKILEFDNVKAVTLELEKVGAIPDLRSFSVIISKTNS